MLLKLALILLPPCGTEDSVGCVWDASTSGNGVGRSFVALAENVIIYLS
jgi:hypothetical protein